MATDRIYVGGTAAITPAFASGWEHTGSAVVYGASTTKPNLSSSTITPTPANSAQQDILFLQIVYPLTAGMKFTSGVDSIHGYFQGASGNANQDTVSVLGARVIASDATTVQATLMTPEAVTGTNPTNEWAPSTLTNRRFPRASASNLVSATYTAVSGDYLVIEVGARKVSASTGAQHFLRRGSATGSTDLGANETDTGATLCPWIELTYTTAVDASATVSSGTLTFTGQSLTGASSTAVATTAGNGVLALTGQALTAARLEYSPPIAKADLTLTGQALTVASADGGASVFTNAEITLTGESVVASWEELDTAILTRGTLTFTGQALTGAAAEVLANLDVGTLTLAGQDAVIRASVSAQAQQGTMTLTGQVVGALALIAALVNSGTLTMTGQSVLVSSDAAAVLSRGQLTFTGTAVVTRVGFSFYQIHII